MFANEDELRSVFQLLTNKEGTFDKDKIDIINCEHSVDVKACPGSGKTTTLLAKLVLLANRMPLESGKGICVLTYTNVAIDEIKSKLGHKADVLFSYPNYFGTMQTFVDDFFASAALQYYYGSRITLVDDDRANNEMYQLYKQIGRSKLSKMLYHSTIDKVFHISLQEIETCGGKDLLQEYKLIRKIKGGFVLIGKMEDFKKLSRREFTKSQIDSLYEIRKKRNSLIPSAENAALYSFIQSSKADFLNNQVLYLGGKFANLKSEAAKEFVSVKEELLKKGFLKFYDSYNLSLRLINEFPCLKDELAERFEYLFVDEMQDTRKDEYDFLNSAFDKKQIKVQYFGDEDQAIFQSAVEGDCLWKARNPLKINVSKRFGNEIATIISPFRFDGSTYLSGNTEIQSLKPTMIVFNNPLSVLPKFVKILHDSDIVVDGKQYKLLAFANKQRQQDTLHRYNIKAVGWSGTNTDSCKLSIQSYYPEYKKSKESSNENRITIYEFINIKKNASYPIIVKNLINGIIEFLRQANVRNEQRYYTKQSLFDFLEDDAPSTLASLKETIANCAALILEGDRNTAVQCIAKLLNEDMSRLFSYDIKIVSDFCNENMDLSLEHSTEQDSVLNVYKSNDVEIKVDTVHSVKGETHVATLYLETFYRTGHESENLWVQFKGENFKPRKGDAIIKEALKIAYVAMSRPRYLLCVAIDKRHFQQEDYKKISKLWNIVKV